MTTLFIVFAAAQIARAADTNPCEAIKAACEKAKFVTGPTEPGNNLWQDCVDPIVNGSSAKGRAGRKLPAVPKAIVSACKSGHGLSGTSPGA